MSTTENQYILGTHDEELARLGLQHRAWQECVVAAWHKAGIKRGQTVLDIGCGPGYATLDLAEIVGSAGQVIAIDKSERFLSFLNSEARRFNHSNIVTHQVDFDHADFPALTADAAWCRWVFAFVRDPKELLSRVANSIRPAGAVVIHEYFDYASWRAIPPSAELEEFVTAVMQSWRDNGGEPNISLQLPAWLEASGFEIRSLRPVIDAVQPGDLKWNWLRTFVEVGRQRLVELGYISEDRAQEIWQAFEHAETKGGMRMTTPAVLEINAVRK